jgi:hypothetical protein
MVEQSGFEIGISRIGLYGDFKRLLTLFSGRNTNNLSVEDRSDLLLAEEMGYNIKGLRLHDEA